MVTHKEALALLRYDEETGRLFWLPRPDEMFKSSFNCRMWNARYAGKEAFTAVGCGGYKTGRIFDKTLLAHRVIWLLATGSWPENHIDHINGVRTDNRLVNLRDVSRQENQRNMRLPKDNKSGAVGVRQNSKSGMWIASISISRRNIHVGSFLSIEDAVAARKAAEVSHGFHQNHGRTQ